MIIFSKQRLLLLGSPTLTNKRAVKFTFSVTFFASEPIIDFHKKYCYNAIPLQAFITDYYTKNKKRKQGKGNNK